MNTVGQYARVATSLATIASILTELATTFQDVQQRTAVDDAMIDALVSASNDLATQATALKSINYTPPA
jgi:hypothetical protein